MSHLLRWLAPPIPIPPMKSIRPLRSFPDVPEKLRGLPEPLQVLPLGGVHLVWVAAWGGFGTKCEADGCDNHPTIWGLCRTHL